MKLIEALGTLVGLLTFLVDCMPELPFEVYPVGC